MSDQVLILQKLGNPLGTPSVTDELAVESCSLSARKILTTQLFRGVNRNHFDGPRMSSRFRRHLIASCGCCGAAGVLTASI